MANKKLVTTLFTQDDCKNCKGSLWKRTDCLDGIPHTPNMLEEEHQHYVCASECEVIGYKIEIYKTRIYELA